ncbi:hypothetical protein F383_39328 [Gossypium arboreum]|nr:hypothetical protein F383_39328 [Gossypium arboreum]
MLEFTVRDSETFC